MHSIHITRVSKSGHHHEHITELGTNAVTFTQGQVIILIETKQATFYTSEGGHVAAILVRTNGTRKYVQTWADGYWQNNLLSLPPCIVAA